MHDYKMHSHWGNTCARKRLGMYPLGKVLLVSHREWKEGLLVEDGGARGEKDRESRDLCLKFPGMCSG